MFKVVLINFGFTYDLLQTHNVFDGAVATKFVGYPLQNSVASTLLVFYNGCTHFGIVHHQKHATHRLSFISIN